MAGKRQEGDHGNAGLRRWHWRPCIRRHAAFPKPGDESRRFGDWTVARDGHFAARIPGPSTPVQRHQTPAIGNVRGARRSKGVEFTVQVDDLTALHGFDESALWLAGSISSDKALDPCSDA